MIIGARRQRAERSDPPHTPARVFAIADELQPVCDNPREPGGNLRIFFKKQMKIVTTDAQENACCGNDDRGAMRLAAEERPFSQEIARTKNLLHFVDTIAIRGSTRFAASAENQEDGVGRVARMKDDGSFRVFRDCGCFEKLFECPGGEQIKERVMRFERFGVEPSVCVTGSGSWRCHSRQALSETYRAPPHHNNY
jgi:hypothetical protein